MKFLLSSLLILAFTACSYQESKNRVATNTVTFEGGRKNKDIWGEELKLDRISWFTGATLSYDLIIGELKRDSNFRKWLSQSEINQIKDCKKIVFALIYANTVDTRSIVTITSQIEKMGYSRLTMPVFSTHLKGHPTFPDRNLDQHRPIGFCKLKNIIPSKDNTLEMPGFTSVKLKL